MTFERNFKPAAIEKLRQEELYDKCLRPDIKNGLVFPAVRKDRMDFYYMGGKLFSYNVRNGFTTHHKYASVIRSNSQRPYVTDSNLEAISSFVEGYKRIKDNCSLYSGVEAEGVSHVYGEFSCARSDRTERVVVLDIEVSLRRNGESKEPEPGTVKRASSDQIDLLLFDTKSRALRFFEAKDFSNREIRALQTNAPKIEKQMKRYREQLENPDVREEMLKGYRKHVAVINQLFEPKQHLPEPEVIDPIPRVLVFGFDSSQYKKLKHEAERLEKKPYSLFVYAIGDIKRVKSGALFSGGKKRWAPTKLES
jgi:hypothetical protein